MNYGDDSIKKELPRFEEVKHEMLPLRGFSKYKVHPEIGKIYSLESRRWLLVNAVGVGDKGYLQTSLKNDFGASIPIYEHEAVYAAVWGEEPKAWRRYGNGEKLEIDHISGDVKDNSISNLRLGTSEDNKKNRSYDVPRNYLTMENARIVRELFEKWEGRKTDFYTEMSKKFDVGKRTIQNAILSVTYKGEAS
ncbi:HNH endonuclease [Bacillus sp. JJ1474]|uniref:HNH endonuclease n=1 Tax=Bacillus sp. JJ1474 TaxID=3122955 RepID=UPI002FFEE88A